MSNSEIKTTGDLRAELAECFLLSKSGNLSGDALRGVIGCANQINISLVAEIKAIDAARRAGEKPEVFGGMKLGIK